MSIESAIEKQIQEAMARGEFDDLEGKGKPLDLDAYFATPEDLRMAFSMLKSNDFVPHEVEMMREIEGLRERLANVSDEAAAEQLRRQINDRSLALRVQIENRNRRNR